MKQVTRWQAEDGTVFDSEEACASHEQFGRRRHEVIGLLGEYETDRLYEHDFKQLFYWAEKEFAPIKDLESFGSIKSKKVNLRALLQKTADHFGSDIHLMKDEDLEAFLNWAEQGAAK